LRAIISSRHWTNSGFPTTCPPSWRLPPNIRKFRRRADTTLHLVLCNTDSREQGREKKANKLEQSGLSLEELERLQQEQFAAAAARHN
jgi:hypothetical protein